MGRSVIIIVLCTILCGCSSVDCPLNNTVYARYELRGEVDTLADTLTVYALREKANDTILLNSKENVSSFEIAMSYTQPTDVLLFSLKDSNSVIRTDTVRVDKTNIPHFESVDCSPSYFHTITNVRWTNNTIDSIHISKPSVNYDTTGGNLHIYFKSSF